MHRLLYVCRGCYIQNMDAIVGTVHCIHEVEWVIMLPSLWYTVALTVGLFFFSYGFYFRKLTSIQKLNPNANFGTIL